MTNAKTTTAAATVTAKPVRASVPMRLGGGDMAMYTAIAGKAPRIDPAAGDLLGPGETQPARVTRASSWSPMVLSLYLRDIARQGALKLNKPEIAAWIRKQSDSAMKRLHESQARLTHTTRSDRAA